MKNINKSYVSSLRLGCRFERLLAGVFLITIVLQYTLLSTAVSYLLLSGVYTVLVAILLFSGRSISCKKPYLILLSVFILFVYIRLLFEPTVGNVTRLGALLTFTLANIIVIPNIISFENFLFSLNRFCAVIVVLGFFPYLGFPTQLFILDLTLWSSRIYWYSNFQTITSIFPNPNQFGSLALIGSIAALYEYLRYRSTVSHLFIFINLSGLLMSNYRTGWVIFLVSIILFGLYMAADQRTFVFSVVSGLTLLFVLLFMMFDVLPGPSVLSELSLGGRRPRWVANVQAFLDQPLWGYGFTGIRELDAGAGNPHNSYLRMFSGFGIIGGILYLIIVIGTAIGSARRVVSYQDATIAILLVGFCILQLFNQLSFIGVSMRSTFMAIIIGYYITGGYHPQD